MAKDHTSKIQKAVLYRMVMDDHICPYGLKSKDLLKRRGFDIEDHHLTTRAKTDTFKEEHDVQSTPQIWIGAERIGGYDELREYFGKKPKDDDATTFQPIIALFCVGFLLAVSITWLAGENLLHLHTIERFIAVSMILLGLQKLQDVKAFSTMFLNYDLLAQRWVPYGYIYAFAETGAGLLMLAGIVTWLSAPAALFIGSVGAASVFKAVYIDKRELKCACVGGSSNVPLGFVSLTENLMMIAMAIWMLTKAFF